MISGTSVSSNSGIKALMTAASGNRVTGILFKNIAITGGFQYTVYGYGWWETTFENLNGNNNTNGFYFLEQSVKVTLKECLMVRSPVATHGDGSFALNCDQLGGLRPQDITAEGCFFYGFDQPVQFGNVLVCALDNCDIDQVQGTGVALTTVNGGCRVRNCWVNLANASATNGIICNALGAPNNDKITIDSNYVIATSAAASSVGITIGGDQDAVSANNNSVGSASAPFVTGISITGNNAIAKFNSIYASTTAVLVNSSASDVEVGPNFVQNGTMLEFTSLTPLGLSFYGRGSFTITLTGMAGTVTGTVNWVANGHTVTLSIASAGIAGTSNATTMTGAGLPQYLWPVTDQTSAFNLIDNNLALASLGKGVVAAASGTITFSKDFAGTAFTSSGLKGINGFNSVYSYS